MNLKTLKAGVQIIAMLLALLAVYGWVCEQDLADRQITHTH